MAPSVSEVPAAAAADRTSGQHEPLFDLITPYEQFPQEITGPTVWEPKDFVDHPEKWIHRWSAAELAEIDMAARAFDASGQPLTAVTAARFPLPTVGALLRAVRATVTTGRGFVLFKGFPVARWGALVEEHILRMVALAAGV